MKKSIDGKYLITTDEESEKLIDLIEKLKFKINPADYSALIPIHSGLLDNEILIFESLRRDLGREFLSFAGYPMYDFFLRNIKEVLSSSKVNTIIDYGCGVLGGEIRELSKTFDSYEVIGYDPRYEGNVEENNLTIHNEMLDLTNLSEKNICLVANNLCIDSYEEGLNLINKIIVKNIPFVLSFCNDDSELTNKICMTAENLDDNIKSTVVTDEYGFKHIILKRAPYIKTLNDEERK